MTAAQRKMYDWLAAHPGWHFPIDVDRALNLASGTAAQRLFQMAQNGAIVCRRVAKNRPMYAAAQHDRISGP